MTSPASVVAMGLPQALCACRRVHATRSATVRQTVTFTSGAPSTSAVGARTIAGRSKFRTTTDIRFQL
jgi:hypothetical protein